MRSMMQVYVKGSREAVMLYEKAFDAKLKYEYLDDDGNYFHAELDILGQVVAISESNDDESFTGNTMQFCFHFGEEYKEYVEKAYNVLSEGAQILIPLGPCSYSSQMISFIDKFGVNWCLFV